MNKQEEYVTVSFNITIDGKFASGWKKKYKRGRETYAFTLDDFASIVFMYDTMIQSGSTYAMDGLMQEAEKMLPKKDKETAQSVFEKYWINLPKTINEEYEERNKGIKGDFSPWPAENDYLKYCLRNKISGFINAPLPVKYGLLHYLYKYCFNSSIDEIKADLNNIPQSIKDIIDNELIKTNHD